MKKTTTELTSPRSKLHQLFKKIKIWLRIKKIKHLAVDNDAIEPKNEQWIESTNSSEAIDINSTQLKRSQSEPLYYSTIRLDNYNAGESYILDSESEVIESDSKSSSNSSDDNSYQRNKEFILEGRRFTIGSVGSIPDFTFDSIPFNDGETVAVQIAKVETNSFKKNKRRYSDHETISFKTSSKKFRLSESTLEQRTLKGRLKRWQKLNTYILTIYPSMSLEVILYARFYLDRECTILTPMIYYEQEFIVSRKYVDYRLLEESMMTLFDLNQFNLDRFLNLQDFSRYGKCQCIQVGYVSKVLVLSFDRSYNITCNKQDVVEMTSRITPVNVI